MKRAGQRWGIQRARRMVRLRAVYRTAGAYNFHRAIRDGLKSSTPVFRLELSAVGHGDRCSSSTGPRGAADDLFGLSGQHVRRTRRAARRKRDAHDSQLARALRTARPGETSGPPVMRAGEARAGQHSVSGAHAVSERARGSRRQRPAEGRCTRRSLGEQLVVRVRRARPEVRIIPAAPWRSSHAHQNPATNVGRIHGEQREPVQRKQQLQFSELTATSRPYQR